MDKNKQQQQKTPSSNPAQKAPGQTQQKQGQKEQKQAPSAKKPGSNW